MKKFLLLILLFTFLFSIDLFAMPTQKISTSVYGFDSANMIYTSARSSDLKYKLDIYIDPAEGEHNYTILLGHNYKNTSGYHNSRVTVLMDNSIYVPFTYILYYDSEVLETGDSELNSSGVPFALFEPDFCTNNPSSGTTFLSGTGWRRFTYSYSQYGYAFDWSGTAYNSAFIDFVKNSSVGAYTGFTTGGNSSSNYLTFTGVAANPEYIYSSELGYVTNVRYSQNTIAQGGMLNNRTSLLDVTVGRYTSTGFDLNNENVNIFYRLVSNEGDVGQLYDIFTSNTLVEGLGKVFNLTHAGDLAITPQLIEGNKIYYGDTYFIRNIKEGSVGSVLLDNYMRNPDGSYTNLNRNHDGIVNNFDVSNINNAGDTFNDNRSYDQSVTNYNYTTNYNTQNDYNDYNTTNNYPSSDMVNIGPASPEGGGINWLTDIDWTKLLESLFGFFTAFLFFVPAVTQVLDFLPFWVSGLIKGLIVAGVSYSVLRGIIYIFREVLKNGD